MDQNDQDMGLWQALVNTVVTFEFHKILGISQVVEQWLPSQRIRSMKLVS
jgi:hypothetical protein